MGWLKGLGSHLLRESMKTIEPSHVIQMEGNGRDQIALEELLDGSRDRVINTKRKRFKPNQSNPRVDSDPDADYVSIDQVADNCQGSEESDVALFFNQVSPKVLNIKAISLEIRPKLNASDLRILSLSFSFLSRPSGFHDTRKQPWMEAEPLVSPSYPTFRANLRDLQIVMAYADVPRTETLYALNATLVGLISIPVQENDDAETKSSEIIIHSLNVPSHEFIGLGIIRCISQETGSNQVFNPTLFVASGIDPKNLSRVNGLMRGDMEIPNWLFTWGLPFVSIARPQGPYTTYSTAEGAGAVAQSLRKRIARTGTRKSQN
jgi:hypothetical protein